MQDTPIPPDAREFIMRHIDSIAQMEALQLLRSDAGVRWNAASLAARLYISETEAVKALAQLQALGLTKQDAKGSSYDCPSQTQEAIIEQVIDAYGRYLIPVTHLIHAKSTGRIREFADAFQIIKGR